MLVVISEAICLLFLNLHFIIDFYLINFNFNFNLNIK